MVQNMHIIIVVRTLKTFFCVTDMHIAIYLYSCYIYVHFIDPLLYTCFACFANLINLINKRKSVCDNPDVVVKYMKFKDI